MTAAEVAELLELVARRDARTAVRRAEDVLSDAGLQILIEGAPMPPVATDLPPDIHPAVDAEVISGLPEAGSRGLAAHTYLTTLEAWAEEFRRIRDAAVFQLLTEGAKPTEVARRTGVSLSSAKNLEQVWRAAGGAAE